jgi:hypothetical protein
MAIDPMLYEKLSGRKGDVYSRMGETLAKDARAKQERDAMPKGVSGGFQVMRQPGMFAQLFNLFRDKSRFKG